MLGSMLCLPHILYINRVLTQSILDIMVTRFADCMLKWGCKSILCKQLHAPLFLHVLCTHSINHSCCSAMKQLTNNVYLRETWLKDGAVASFSPLNCFLSLSSYFTCSFPRDFGVMVFFSLLNDHLNTSQICNWNFLFCSSGCPPGNRLVFNSLSLSLYLRHILVQLHFTFIVTRRWFWQLLCSLFVSSAV